MKNYYKMNEQDMAPKPNENTATRIPIVLALDVSASMGTNGRYVALNAGVAAFYATCRNDEVNRYGFDVAIVTFGGKDGVQVCQDFAPVWYHDNVPSFERPVIKNGTPLGAGVETSLRLLQQRQDEYERNSISHTRRGFLFVITDGVSTEVHPRTATAQSRETFASAARHARQMASGRLLEVVPVGVGRSSYEHLAQFTLDGKVLTTEDFSVFELLFESLSASVSSSASQEESGGPTISLVEQMLAYAEDEGIESLRVQDFVIDNS